MLRFQHFIFIIVIMTRKLNKIFFFLILASRYWLFLNHLIHFSRKFILVLNIKSVKKKKKNRLVIYSIIRKHRIRKSVLNILVKKRSLSLEYKLIRFQKKIKKKIPTIKLKTVIYYVKMVYGI